VPAVASTASPVKPGVLLIEARLPGLSEPVSAIALGGLRSLLRAPEAKMMLLSPLIMVPIFGSMMLRGSHQLPESFRPLVAIGAMVFVLFGVLQLMGNQFGFDRDGFRVFVLCGADRRDILLGKNLAFAPLVLGMAAILLPIVQLVNPMRMDHLLAMFPQYVSMYLLFCILANLLSIYAPVRVAAGAMKSSNPKLSTALLQLAMFTFLFPLTQAVTLLPLGIEALLKFLGWTRGAPIYLVLSLAECAVIVILYHFSLVWLGGLFQAREQGILESVTDRAP
jgi:ABC-2 type transport system permease protein